jgi:hypothetical protein
MFPRIPQGTPVLSSNQSRNGASNQRNPGRNKGKKKAKHTEVIASISEVKVPAENML